MKIYQVAVKELFERSGQLWTGIIAISLGIAVMVAAGSMMRFSEKAVADELDALGTVLLVLPKDATVHDYYTADIGQLEMPDNYLTTLTDSGSLGIQNITAKLSVPIVLRGKKATLTGVLPKSNFEAAAIPPSDSLSFMPTTEWSTLSASTPESTVPMRIIDDLGPDRVAIGSELGTMLKLKQNDVIDVLGAKLIIDAVLPAAGNVDDSRVFARLGTVQQLTGKTGMINSIEISGCNPALLPELTKDINERLPGARVATIHNLVATHQQINLLMRRIAGALLIMMILVGGAGIANFMFANVYERRREIGIYAALGATSGWIVRLFLFKALIIGMAGGLLGYLIGTGLAMTFGAAATGVPVGPIGSYVAWSVVIAVLIAFAGSILPAIKAAVVDPSSIMKEE